MIADCLWLVDDSWWLTDDWIMGRPDFENLRVCQLAEQLANEIWKIVATWDYFAKDTLGKQMVRSADRRATLRRLKAFMRFSRAKERASGCEHS